MRYEEDRTTWESLKLLLTVAVYIAVGIAMLFLAVYLVGLIGAFMFWMSPILGNIFLGILGILLLAFFVLTMVDVL